MTQLSSPRTSHRFQIDRAGVEAACELTWQSTPEDFVTMSRMCFGLPIDGPPPLWHLLEVMRILSDGGQPK